MDTLIEKSLQKVKAVDIRIIRKIMDEIDWNDRLIGIRGARGVGKTKFINTQIGRRQSKISMMIFLI
ncbi:hypothetical protein FACS189426_11610 [Bacteroidia bacterium]|nr:hypothetical protein FACS189426_11610 [Bacteroidia bacterium]